MSRSRKLKKEKKGPKLAEKTPLQTIGHAKTPYLKVYGGFTLKAGLREEIYHAKMKNITKPPTIDPKKHHILLLNSDENLVKISLYDLLNKKDILKEEPEKSIEMEESSGSEENIFSPMKRV